MSAHPKLAHKPEVAQVEAAFTENISLLPSRGKKRPAKKKPETKLNRYQAQLYRPKKDKNKAKKEKKSNPTARLLTFGTMAIIIVALI